MMINHKKIMKRLVLNISRRSLKSKKTPNTSYLMTMKMIIRIEKSRNLLIKFKLISTRLIVLKTNSDLPSLM